MIHVDTSFLVRALVRGSPQDRSIRVWLRSGEALAMSTVGWAEFLCGPLEATEAELAGRIVTDRIPLVEEDSALAARLFNDSGRRRGSLADCLIAATALRRGASLATTNPADFRRFEAAGLNLTTPP